MGCEGLPVVRYANPLPRRMPDDFVRIQCLDMLPRESIWFLTDNLVAGWTANESAAGHFTPADAKALCASRASLPVLPSGDLPFFVSILAPGEAPHRLPSETDLRAPRANGGLGEPTTPPVSSAMKQSPRCSKPQIPPEQAYAELVKRGLG